MSVTRRTVQASTLFPKTKLSPVIAELGLHVYDHDPEDPGKIFVPAVDPDFEFNVEALEALILGDVLHKPTYIFGETGCGKTAMVRQFCAVRGKELVRQNFDEHIGRGEIVGVPMTGVEGAHMTVKFRRGSLLTALNLPCTYLLDEFDCGTPSATVVLNPILETENPKEIRLHVPETSEIVLPHDDWRVVATGNTDGVNPDERGIYAGTQTQNMASLNRFAYRIRLPYNDEKTERRILRSKFPQFPDGDLDMLVRFTEDYRKAFKNTRELSIPLSTRMVHSIAETTLFTESLFRSIALVLLSSIPDRERQVVTRLATAIGISAT